MRVDSARVLLICAVGSDQDRPMPVTEEWPAIGGGCTADRDGVTLCGGFEVGGGMIHAASRRSRHARVRACALLWRVLRRVASRLLARKYSYSDFASSIDLFRNVRLNFVCPFLDQSRKHQRTGTSQILQRGRLSFVLRELGRSVHECSCPLHRTCNISVTR
jgi:hypothetical protein